MGRKIDIENINLKVDEVQPFDCGDVRGLIFMWRSDIGFGKYTIIQEYDVSTQTSKLFIADSEGMDKDDDKAFGKKLFELWMEQVLIIG